MNPSRSALLATALLLSSFAILVAGPTAAAATHSFTLYGAVTKGWGFGPNNITNPGPSLTVAVGDTVKLELFSNDSVEHTWFIDFNGNLTADANEPISGSITSSTVATWFNFTVPSGHVGTYTYRCSIHPTTMTGSITIQAAPPAPNIVLYGSATQGWGFGSANMSNPGPTLRVATGANVKIELISADHQAHSFFIDLDGNGAVFDANDTGSPTFGGTQPDVINWTFNVATAGTYHYYCRIHTTAMQGMIIVGSGSTTTPPSGPDYTLYAALIIVVVIVAVAAAVLLRRRPRAPPAQPPQQGP